MRERGRWGRFALLLAITALVLVPVGVPVWGAVQQSARQGGLLPAIASLLGSGPALGWLGSSLLVTTVTVVVSVALGAPAGYALSRARGRAVDAFGLAVFVLQALPVVVMLIPLFLVFIGLGLFDSLLGLSVVYVGLTVAVSTWTMASAIDAVPVSIEEAAWIDGTSVLGGFLRVVLPNAVPGLLATAVLTFLFAWNEYLVAVTFLTTDTRYTLAVGMAARGGDVLALVVMIPPLVVFAVLHRFFRFGGMAGAVTG